MAIDFRRYLVPPMFKANPFKLVLRDYQSAAVDALFTYFDEHEEGNPIEALPTGTGKSIVIADFVARVVHSWPTQRILVVTHVKELVEQNFKTLLRHWPTAPAGIYSAGLGRKDLHERIVFAGVMSIAKAKLFPRFDLIIVDECHTVSPKDDTTYAKLFERAATVNPAVRVIGFTATPYRMKGGHLIEQGGTFTHLAYDITTADSFVRLIDEGYLCPLVPKAPQTELTTEGVRTTGGDYNAGDLEKAVDLTEVNTRAVEELLHYGADRARWLVFTAGTTHADHIAALIREAGISVGVVHSKHPEDRDEAVDAFKAGKLRCIVNQNILTTGFDCPDVDLIAVLRPTRSPGLWVQMLGRGTRIHQNKTDCLVLDFAGNTKRLGPINDPVIRRPGQRGDGVAPYKACPACFTYVHASATVCPVCGQDFPRQTQLAGKADTRALVAREEVEDTIEEVKVDSITYRLHTKAGATPSLRVCYSCGLNTFNEWVCFGHTGFPRVKARRWWGARTEGSETDVPDSAEEALRRIGELNAPRLIRVATKRKFPEVMECTREDCDVRDENCPF